MAVSLDCSVNVKSDQNVLIARSFFKNNPKLLFKVPLNRVFISLHDGTVHFIISSHFIIKLFEKLCAYIPIITL